MRLYANPYSFGVPGFYFEDTDTYDQCYKRNLRRHGAEEYMIDFIDGTEAECQLAEAAGLSQGNFRLFMEFMQRGLEDWQYAGAFERMSNQGYDLEEVAALRADDLAEDIRHICTDCYSAEGAILDYAHQFLDDCGTLADIPDELRGYFDFKAYARDMGYNGTFEFCGVWYVCE